MKVLVTGAAGFIGSHLAEALCRQGSQVVALDNLALGTPENLDWRKPGDSLDFIRGDAGDPALLRRIVPGCEWVFHQAAMPSVPLSIAEPLATNAHNLDAALQLLVAARDAGVKRFLFASSSAIYGDSDGASNCETQPPAPRSPYALQKYAAEKYAHLFFELYGLETVSLRYFNVFGPRQSFDSPYSGVIARFCTAMLEGKPPTIFGDGTQSRDFTYISNVVRANLQAAAAPAERVAGRVFNVATGRSISLLQLAGELNRLTGQSLQPVFQPPRPGDIHRSEADISAVRRALDYQIDVPWEEGLRLTLDYYRLK